MRARLIFFALSAGVAFGQADVARVFPFHHIVATQDLNEFATMVRTVSDLRQINVDTAKKSMSVHGTAVQIAIAEWLFNELDQASLPVFATKEFKVPDKEDDVVRVYFLAHAATVQQFQEVATTVRTVAEIRRVFTFNSPKAMAVRGTADQIAAAEFLVRELDQPAGAKRVDSRQYHMIDTRNMGFTEVRVFYLPYAATVQQLQEAATLVRTVGDIRQVFTYNAPRALTVRGTGDQVALADWMVHALAKPGDSRTYTYPDVNHDGENLVRICYVKDVPTVAAFQQVATRIRTATKIRRVFTYNETRAMAVRGTSEQLAMAEQMLKDRELQAAAK